MQTGCCLHRNPHLSCLTRTLPSSPEEFCSQVPNSDKELRSPPRVIQGSSISRKNRAEFSRQFLTATCFLLESKFNLELNLSLLKKDTVKFSVKESSKPPPSFSKPADFPRWPWR